MPAVSTGFAAGNVPAGSGGPAVAPARAAKSPAGADHQPLSEEGEFDRVMQARLGPDSHQGKGAGTDKTSTKENRDQKDLTTAPDDKNVAEKGAPLIAPENSQSLPPYFPLPLLLSPTGEVGSVCNNDQATDVAAQPVATVLAAISATSMATGKIMVRNGEAENAPATASRLTPENSGAGGGFSSAGLKPVSPESATSPTVQALADIPTNSPQAELAQSKDPLLAQASPSSIPTAPASAQAETAENNPPQISETDTPTPAAVAEAGRHNGAATDTGMGVAINAASMKNPQKANKVAEPNAQVLPVGNSNDAFEKNLPTSRSTASVRPVENHGSDFNLPFSQGDEPRPIVDRPAVSPVTELPSTVDGRMRGVERVHDMISLHSMRLVESKSDTLAVIIKPAVGTELSLELRHGDGGVEAHAILTRGDYQFLSQHWPDLQQRLEQRGIRLQPLAGEGPALANDQGQSQRQPASPEDPAQQASAFAEFASHAGGASARLAPMHDGWESWA